MEEKKRGAWAITVRDKSPAVRRRGAMDKESHETSGVEDATRPTGESSTTNKK